MLIANETGLENFVSVTIKYPHDLLTTLATMKSAKENGVGMSIWDSDIKAVEDAITVLAALTAAERVRATDPAIARTEQEMHDLGLTNAPRGAAEALVKAVRGSEWQPIETAPKDGSMFIAYNTAHRDMYVVGKTDTPDDDDPWCWTDVGGNNRGIGATFNHNYFQFWHPLPVPPLDADD